MSHLDGSLADVRTLADHPLIGNGETSSLRMVAPGSATAGRYGLVEFRVAPHSPGAAPHYHRTFSESFYILDGTVRLFDGANWVTAVKGDYLYVPPNGIHAFRNESDAFASMLILFAPGAPREKYFTELVEIRETGRELSAEEYTEFLASHDQYMV